MAARVVDRATDVVAAWLRDGRSPRAVLAELPALRGAPAAERAAVAAAAAVALAGMRRFEFVLAGAGGLADLPALARARALVLAGAVAGDGLLAASASRQFAAATGHGLDFAPLLAVESALAATADSVVRFGRRHSVPDWFAARAMAQFGADADAVVQALQPPAPRTVRANRLRVGSRAELAAHLLAEGIATTPARFAAEGLHVGGDADLFATAAYRRGEFEQQDEASQLVAALVAPPPGGRVLDLCAGNGGKTLAIAAALQNRGVVLATDVHEGRLAALRERARRAGAGNVEARSVGEAEWPPRVREFAARADRILVDAPCSGTGSWRRRPEARWRVVEPDLAPLQRTQQALLAQAAAALRPGARLVYATCSLLAEENEAQVARLLAAEPGLEVVRIAEILGGAAARPIADADGVFLVLRPDRHGCDGFFAAVLRRRRGGDQRS
jgi:16S rRNA (cytosine967-C5)-methyltransferase